jgi:hypothetical protein
MPHVFQLFPAFVPEARLDRAMRARGSRRGLVVAEDTENILLPLWPFCERHHSLAASKEI